MKQVATVVFQTLMTFIGIWLLYIAYSIITTESHPNVSKISMFEPAIDSVVTRILKMDSSGEGKTTEQEVKKDYSLSGSTEGDNTSECVACFKERHDIAFDYIILSAGILALAFFLPKIQSFTFKDVSLTVREAVEQINQTKEELVDVVNSSQEAMVGEGGKGQITGDIKSISMNKLRGVIAEDDPQKGLWSGLSTTNDRQLSATVSEISGTDFYRVRLKVTSTNPENSLSGKVIFHLHDTFRNMNPVILVQKGVARLSLIAWGAFTVGAEADNGGTKLELDLASDEVVAPNKFKTS